MHLEFGSKVLVMGILNVTPDSFSDGGRFFVESAIAAQVDTMVKAGADIIDVGGESTRPYAEPVPIGVELDRVLPAIRLIRQRSAIPISIDTTKAEVARKALAGGANIINDISALRFDRDMISLVKETEVPVIIMLTLSVVPGMAALLPLLVTVFAVVLVVAFAIMPSVVMQQPATQ